MGCGCGCETYEIETRRKVTTAACSSCPNGLASNWIMTVPAGITGDDCHNGACTPFSGTFIFEPSVGQCQRRSTERLFGLCPDGTQWASGNDGRWSFEPRAQSGPTLTHWILFCQVFVTLVPTVVRTVAMYTLPIEDFDCTGPNTFPQLDISAGGTFFTKATKPDACTNWPSELTITPI